MPSSSSVLSAAFLADAQALLQAHGLVSDQAAVTDAAAPSAAAAPAKQTKRKREDLVLDAALGEGSWRVDERDEAVDDGRLDEVRHQREVGDDVGAGGGELVDLGDALVDVVGVPGRHGLDADGRGG